MLENHVDFYEPEHNVTGVYQSMNKFLPKSILVVPGQEQPGDIYSSKGTGSFVAWLIRVATDSDICHVGGIISEWHNGSILTVDAYYPKVNICEQTKLQGQVWRLWQNEEEQKILVDAMKAEVGKPYDIFNTARIGIYGLCRMLTFGYWKPVLPIFGSEGSRFCSEICLRWVQILGWKHRRFQPKEIHPGEFARFMNWYIGRSNHKW